MNSNKEKEYQADTSTRYEMRRCVENESKEQVLRRLKRAAGPMILLIGVLVILWIVKL